MTRLASIFFAADRLRAAVTANQPPRQRAPVPDVLIDLLLTPGGWIVLGIAAVAVIALIVRASRD